MHIPFETNFIAESRGKTPFADTATQCIFEEWCKINDSIAPQFIDRTARNQRGKKNILSRENIQKKYTLLLPTDLQLREMLDIIKTIDQNTFTRRPEKQEETVNQIRYLGEVMENAGMYLHQYLPIFDQEETKKIVAHIALEFYQYGRSLQNKTIIGEQILSKQLTNEDKDILDARFLGQDAYQKRVSRWGHHPTQAQKENSRVDTLRIYFEALSRTGYPTTGPIHGEIRVGPIQYLKNKTKQQIIYAIETPERAMKIAIFRRGVEKMMTEIEMPCWEKTINDKLKSHGLRAVFKLQNIYDALRIDDLKQELNHLRESGDTKDIAIKELEVAKKIQKAVSSLPYHISANFPSSIIENQNINCMGASMLGGGLLDEVGIKYAHATIPQHSATVLITSDGKTYWQDFTPGSDILKENYTELTADMLEGKEVTKRLGEIGQELTFSKFNPYSFVSGKLKAYLTRPEVGLPTIMFNSIGHSLRDHKKGVEAIAAYKQGILLDPNYVGCYSGLGSTLRSLNKNEEAIVAYHQAILIDPTNANLYLLLGCALDAINKHEEAIIAYHQAILIDPNDANLYQLLGLVLDSINKHEEAIVAYHQAILIDPNDANLYRYLGNALHSINKYEEAIVAYHQAILIDPNDARLYRYLGNALHSINKYEEAIVAYHQAKLIDPTNASTYNGIGVIYTDLGKYEHAIKMFQHATRIDPNDASAYFYLGSTLSSINKHEEAIVAFNQAIQIDPNNVAFCIGLGNEHYTLGDFNGAATEFKRGINIDPSNTKLYLGLVRTLIQLGKLGEAIEVLKQVSILDPKDPVPYFCLGQLLGETGEYDAAIKAYQLYKSLGEINTDAIDERIAELKKQQIQQS